MHKQLVLLHNAVSAYFSGNAAALEGTIKQFNVKVVLILGHEVNVICTLELTICVSFPFNS